MSMLHHMTATNSGSEFHMGGTLVLDFSLAASLNILMANEELSHRIPNNNWSLREMEGRRGEGMGGVHNGSVHVCTKGNDSQK